ncbi:MalY/PatB family protein [Blastococcus sp. PRF04-17]|uniref:MalY/PatB family protein n=1 Tax=Blastococcus sp. PRF04-17 TaxID=2933797 RepID=UPI001FF3DB14|nr:aminotransferase class I/II-fold pyridoxal phosphate-dependent enzyme [Blastococcus sp. PRF04-17]UOY02538.1 aminotransferase class I/II-fold pyridoxal phosphate-dependent enzyme [Blastococcus sp. PRF04-17]
MSGGTPDGQLGFDALSEDALRATGSLKWTRYGPALGAFVAEMDFGTAPVVTRALHDAVDRGRLGYLTTEAADGMARACAGWQARRYGWSLPAERISPLADVVAGLQAAIEHFSPPGSAVVLPTPAYMPFLTVPAILGRELLEVPMIRGDDGRMTYDLDGIARAFDRGGRLFVHVNPHNPLGRVFDEREQLALAEVVAAAGVRVFADEIHAPLVHPGAVHRPYASLTPATARHTVTATSASKAWNLPGLKAAQLLLSDADDAARWAEAGVLFGHGASTPGVLASTAAYDEGGPWLDDVLTYLDGNRRLLGELLAERLPQVRYDPPEGTYLGWLDCRELGLAGSAGDFFLERAGVALVDGPECGGPGAGHVRLNFATPRPVLRTIVDRMADAVDSR